jgi:TonB family protein
MLLDTRSHPGSLRTRTSFGISATIHGSILAWLALSPGGPPEPRLSLYEMEVQPHEKQIVWYNLRERLPDVAPAATHNDPRLPRALRQFEQTLASGDKDNPHSPQMIFMDAPEVRTAKPLPLPNVLAIAPPPRPLREFTPPEGKPRSIAPPNLPDAPPVTAVDEARNNPLETKLSRPLKNFTPPPEQRSRRAPVMLAEAPEIEARNQSHKLPFQSDTRAPLRRFNAPDAPPVSVAATKIPEAPAVAGASESRRLPLPSDLRAPLKKFTAPPGVRGNNTPVTLADAPAVAVPNQAGTLPIKDDPRAPLRRFNAPPPAAPATNVRNSALPDAPAVAVAHEAHALPFRADPRAPLKKFTAPPDRRVANAPAAIVEAPAVAVASQSRNLPIASDPRAPLRRFNAPPPAAPGGRVANATIPEAPGVAVRNQAAGNLPIASDPRAPLRRFNAPPPAAPGGRVANATIPEAPGVAVRNQAAGNLPIASDPRAPLRRFNAPPSGAPSMPAKAHAQVQEAPSIAAGGLSRDMPLAIDPQAIAPPPEPPRAKVAIASLNPSDMPDFPPPPGSRQAGFSGGPQVRKEGGDGAKEADAIVVPWLTARGGGKDAAPALTVNTNPMAPENLIAVARGTPPGLTPDAALPAATRVTSAPDSRLQGRAVYSIAIQMPNVTSFSGSWVVWFAERTPIAGAPPPEVRAPVPLRKVDPKYITGAVEERIEGSVRLFAVIRADGRVESVHLLKHLDERLDRSAQEALAKWVFEPALRNGAPMDVEAVFEIPFHLAPRTPR